MDTLGKLLKQLRIESKVTQEYLSESIKYSRKQIVRVENDQQLPSLELLYNLSVFYNIDLIQYLYFIHNNIDVNSYI